MFWRRLQFVQIIRKEGSVAGCSHSDLHALQKALFRQGPERVLALGFVMFQEFEKGKSDSLVVETINWPVSARTRSVCRAEPQEKLCKKTKHLVWQSAAGCSQVPDLCLVKPRWACLSGTCQNFYVGSLQRSRLENEPGLALALRPLSHRQSPSTFPRVTCITQTLQEQITSSKNVCDVSEMLQEP